MGLVWVVALKQYLTANLIFLSIIVVLKIETEIQTMQGFLFLYHRVVRLGDI